MQKVYKIAILFLALYLPTKLLAQVSLTVHSTEFMLLDSYLGLETNETSNRLYLQYQGTQINYPHWSISARLLQPIVPQSATNISGQPFPAEKISFRLRSDDNQEINLNSIGANRSNIFLNPSSEVDLIKRSNSPIYILAPNSTYKNANLNFSLKIEGGAYLDQYKNTNKYNPIQYRIPILFTLYDQQHNVISSYQKVYTLQIGSSLKDAPSVPVEPDYSIVISNEVSDASLVFNTQNDYENGVSSTYTNAVKINAIQGYELQVKSLSNALTDIHGETLDLSSMEINLTAGSGAKTVWSNPTVTLSSDPKVVLSGTSNGDKTVQHFDVRYKASLTKQQIRSTNSGAYNVSIMYMLLPK